MDKNLDKEIWHTGFLDDASMEDLGLGEGRVQFYKLGKRFVDSEKSIPKESGEIMYYTLSVGHHTGIIDCFECDLSIPDSLYNKILGLLDDEEAKRKMEGVFSFGEIQIDKSHVSTLLPAFRRSFAGLEVFNEVGKIAVPLKGDDFDKFLKIIDLLISVRDEPAMYLMVRRSI